MKIDPHAYTVSVRKVDVGGDAYFEATVRELPDVRDYGATFEEAYSLAIDTIVTAANMFEEQGRAFPAPQDDHYY